MSRPSFVGSVARGATGDGSMGDRGGLASAPVGGAAGESMGGTHGSGVSVRGGVDAAMGPPSAHVSSREPAHGEGPLPAIGPRGPQGVPSLLRAALSPSDAGGCAGVRRQAAGTEPRLSWRPNEAGCVASDVASRLARALAARSPHATVRSARARPASTTESSADILPLQPMVQVPLSPSMATVSAHSSTVSKPPSARMAFAIAWHRGIWLWS